MFLVNLFVALFFLLLFLLFFVYYYCNIIPEVWYTHYIYDGTYWYLGEDSWDGIYRVDSEPKYGIVDNKSRFFFGVFTTEEEAYECIKKRY